MGKHYDYVVIGSGPAGHASAIKAAQLGMKVAVIEKDQAMFGGVCLNEGCIPAKSLYRSAGTYDLFRKESSFFGMSPEAVTANMKDIVGRSREASETLKKGLAFVFKKNGIDVVSGTARFAGNEIRVTEKGGESGDLSFSKALIASGSRPKSVSAVPFDGSLVMTSSDAIRLETLPRTIAIVGAGYIGAEMASYFNLLGTEVTLLEMERSILPADDPDVSRRMQAIFKQRGINVLTGCVLTGVEKKGDRVMCRIASADSQEEHVFEKMLISTGRAPNTGELGLETTGISADDRGFIPVDGSMRTSCGNVFAAGDVVPGPMLAHAAYLEGETAALAAAGMEHEPVDHSNTPNAVYTEIQAASVGITEPQAAHNGAGYATGKTFYKANGKAVVNRQTEGFIKVIADKATRRILGAHILGHDASDLIHEFAVAKKAGLTVDDIAGTVHAHPTLSEAAADACRAVFGKPIHG